MIYDNPPRTIDARMQAIHVAILQERGIQPAVSVCDESTDDVESPDPNGSSWRNFDKWNDAPIFAWKRRKAQVG